MSNYRMRLHNAGRAVECALIEVSTVIGSVVKINLWLRHGQRSRMVSVNNRIAYVLYASCC
jgi:hypothetical protein